MKQQLDQRALPVTVVASASSDFSKKLKRKETLRNTLIGRFSKVPPPIHCCALIGRASAQLGTFPPFQCKGAGPKLRSLTCGHHDGDGGGVGRRSRFFSPRVFCSLRAGRRSRCYGGLLGSGAGWCAAEWRIAGAAAAANRGR